jgi:DNA-binding MarR family transcriptional regulator
MHALTFAIKRTFQGYLRITRPWFAHFKLTPARFDLLYAIERIPARFILQSTLRRILGVTAATVSRMVSSLEALGFVTRSRCRVDARQRFVQLTERGVDAITRAIRETIPSRAKLIVDSAFVHKWFDDDIAFQDTCFLEDRLRLARSQFRDTATLSFPWHPDD